jgi:oxygen-independent coproporphyrinogen-3 oxidase
MKSIAATDKLSAYIHIPFCTHKCEFCDFAAFAGLNHLEQKYCDVLCREITERLDVLLQDDQYRDSALISIFYGGGTPGLIESENLARIHHALLDRLPLASDVEVTLETTPHAITDQKAKDWLKLGINRISIGVESLVDNELKAIGRDHSRQMALDGIAIAKQAGFQNISCDLMYGLPTQTNDTFKNSISQLLSIAKETPIKHISAYGLGLAQNSPLYSKFPKGDKSYPNDDQFVDMYQTLVYELEQNGFEQYELSNFSRPGYRSIHNLSYWQNDQYLGFGVSAHRYVNHVRSSNWRSLNRYLDDYLGHETYEPIDGEISAREAIMLGLRLREGIDLGKFEQSHGFNLEERFAAQIKRLCELGLLQVQDGRMKITQKAVPVSNSVIAEFF